MKFPKAGDLPKELTILAGVLMALGAFALVQAIISIVNQNGANINFMVLLLLAGFGLIRLKPYWRLFTLTISIVTLIFVAAPLVIALIRWAPPYGQGQSMGFIVSFWITTVVGLGACGWALYVLNKPSIARLFTK
ncbi:hypothetical protein H5P28_09535 [Ruficoccus amylovorans]|uniref:Uncharacterized protein n=1 Tax=Ruficoccus amylovorans TaxID=1804625 RepID=A0A842HEN2_9BACT|nr:hypothetical protein [Ruficoccus amylovorans]MBC2594498.1 hypothetical protein [Ruficoccus amylovorans]